MRATICAYLPEMVTKSITREGVLSLFQQFSKDSNQTVKAALISSIGRTISTGQTVLTESEAKMFYISMIPVIKTMVKEAYVAGHIELLDQFSKYMGSMTNKFSSEFTNDDDYFFAIYS